MDPTYVNEADPYIKVEPDTESDDREASVFSSIVVQHPHVKMEPQSDPYDYEGESSLFTMPAAHSAVSEEPQSGPSGHMAESIMASNMTTLDDSMTKVEPKQEPSDEQDQQQNQQQDQQQSNTADNAMDVDTVFIKDEPEFDVYAPERKPYPQPDITLRLNQEQTVRVLNIGLTKEKRMARMKEQGRSILTLCRNARSGIKADRAEEMSKRFADAHMYIDWIDTNLEMTPDIKNATKLDLVLKTLSTTPNIPGDLVNKARYLHDRYDAENWGQDAVVDEEFDAPPNTAAPTLAGAAGAASNIGEVVNELILPSPTDPIFGEHGIMYGIIIDTNGKGGKTYRLRADIPRKSCKVYGHNDIPVGTWFPFQINALFWGAHGARMGGIAGSTSTGAWSIVVANAYEDLDSDYGDTLYYSGSNSHTNADPNRPAPPSSGTKALLASINTGHPVRVLRSGGNIRKGNNQYLPTCGLRYDGLYRVHSRRVRTNMKNGLYDQFRLERLPGQTPLIELQATSPTREQIKALNKLRGR